MNNDTETQNYDSAERYDVDLEKRFNFQDINDTQIIKLSRIQAQCKNLAYLIKSMTTHSREQSLALTHLEETFFWCNAAISRIEPSEDER